jgi:hypothetical protein
LTSHHDDGIVVDEESELMRAGGAVQALVPMNERDEYLLQAATDRFERRLAEETGKLRVDMATGFGELRAEMATGAGSLRAEMIERNHELLKWALVFWATQIAAVAGLLALFR